MVIKRITNDKETYYRQLFEYYNGAKYNYDWDQARRSLILGLEERRKLLSPFMKMIPKLFSGKHVLELACGSGIWTKYLAEVAESVVAIDISPNIIKVARSSVITKNVKFMVCDARNLNTIPGSFNAAFHVNFINHIPFSDWTILLNGLHKKLDPDALVLMYGQPYQGEYLTHNQNDHYSHRLCENGKTYKVIDHDFVDKDSIVSRLGPNVTNVNFYRNFGWYVSYTVKK